MKKRVIIIGAGFAGLSAAALLAKDGYNVTVIEKNSAAGGRAGQIKEAGYTFDIGPSWYMIPEVYENYFAQFGKKSNDFYSLQKLIPSYRVFFEEPEQMVDVPAELEDAYKLFDSIEPGSAKKIERFMKDAEFKYNMATSQYIYRNFRSVFDFLSIDLIKQGLKMALYRSVEAELNTYVKDKRLKQLLSWHTVFLGGSPKSVPSLYSLMAYADFVKNIWYPEEGFHSVVKAMQLLGESHGVTFMFDTAVESIVVKEGKATGVITQNGEVQADIVIANADYHHVETKLLPAESRTYSDSYWQSRRLGCATFVMCLGVKKRVKNLLHHNYFFSKDWDNHFDALFENPEWPQNPSYYISAASKTDPKIAPQGKENLFLLVPVAPGLEDTDTIRDAYAQKIISHLEKLTDQQISADIEVQHIISQRDHQNWYNAYRGNALGIAHTLFQTAFLRPSMQSKKVKNLYFTGQYTQPGTSVPIAIVSGQLVHKEILNS
jgi:phytoene desaturase